MKIKIVACALAGLCAWCAGGAESNAVALDVLSDGPRWLDAGTVSFPLDWEGGLAPAGASQATLSVSGTHYNVSATVAKPAAAIACTLFETPPEPFRSDSLKVTLTFASADGELTASHSATFDLTAGTFDRGRVLTCPVTAGLWRRYAPPVDLPFDARWFLYLQGANLTWASASNLTTGVAIESLEPLTGIGKAYGFIPLEKDAVPADRWYLKLWSVNTPVADAELNGVKGLMMIFR